MNNKRVVSIEKGARSFKLAPMLKWWKSCAFKLNTAFIPVETDNNKLTRLLNWDVARFFIVKTSHLQRLSFGKTANGKTATTAADGPSLLDYKEVVSIPSPLDLIYADGYYSRDIFRFSTHFIISCVKLYGSFICDIKRGCYDLNIDLSRPLLSALCYWAIFDNFFPFRPPLFAPFSPSLSHLSGRLLIYFNINSTTMSYCSCSWIEIKNSLHYWFYNIYVVRNRSSHDWQIAGIATVYCD